MHKYSGASIVIASDQDRIDPARVGTDADIESAREYILAAVRAAFPGADVRADTGWAAQTSGLGPDGQDFTRNVQLVVWAAWDAWCALPHP